MAFPYGLCIAGALRKFVEDNGGVFVMPEDDDAEHILQYSGNDYSSM